MRRSKDREEEEEGGGMLLLYLRWRWCGLWWVGCVGWMSLSRCDVLWLMASSLFMRHECRLAVRPKAAAKREEAETVAEEDGGGGQGRVVPRTWPETVGVWVRALDLVGA